MTNDERQVLLKLCESFIGLADSQLETHRLVFSRFRPEGEPH
jgi:hypothetical protein